MLKKKCQSTNAKEEIMTRISGLVFFSILLERNIMTASETNIRALA